MTRALAALLTISLTAAPLTAAAMKYIGFGDSITRGTGDPVAPNVVFDEASPQCKTKPNKCGYVRRLEEALDGMGVNATVVNKGIAGETTAEGLSRINSVLSQGGDVIILMEGTNDWVQGVSNPSVDFNLRQMVDRATDRGIDTLVSSIIRKIHDRNNSKVTNLKNRMSDIAADKSRAFANPWLPLCPKTSCFNTHYYAGDPDIGHLDASGYDILTDVYLDVITPEGTPTAPDPASPIGDVDDAPTFTWPAITGVRWYRLEVDGGATFDDWLDAAVICSGGNCSHTLGSALAAGSHSWRVRARTLFDQSPWSAVENLFVFDAAPGAATLSDPSGTIFVDQPTYNWNKVPDTTSYQLVVSNGGGNVVNESYDTAICGGSTCSATPATTLAAGDYDWQVRTSNPAGNGPWSGSLMFTVINAAPGGTSGIYPVGEIFDTTPLYRWLEIGTADQYTLSIFEGANSLFQSSFDAATVCGGSTCSTDATVTLTPGDHRFRVRPLNPIGSGPWSDWIDFKLLACSPLDFDVPAGSITTDVTHRACRTVTAGAGVVVEAGGKLTLHAGETIEVGNDFSVLGGELMLFAEP